MLIKEFRLQDEEETDYSREREKSRKYENNYNIKEEEDGDDV